MLPRILPYACIGYLLGVGFGSVYFLKPFLFVQLLVAVLLLFVLFFHNKFVKILLIFYFCVSIGVIQSNIVARADNLKIEKWETVAKLPIILEGTVNSIEQEELSSKVLVDNLVVSKNNEKFPGVLEIKIPTTEEIPNNSTIKITGKIMVPESKSSSAGHFNPQRYYARFGIYGSMNNPHIKILETGNSNIVEKTRMLARSVLQRYLPEPSAGLFSATLLGYMHDVPLDLRNAFSASGLAHLVAISGQHIAMMAVFIFFIGLRMGLSRNYAAMLTIFTSVIFIALVDYPPSGIRSIIMIIAVYTAYSMGKRSNGLRVLLLTCSLMVMVNPRILLVDLGFQLSALAMWGLIVFYPVLIKISGKNIFWGREILFMTLSAMFTTTPIIGYAFGKVSVVGVWANIMAGPIYPVLMCLGVLLIFLGWVPLLGVFISTSAHYLTQFFLTIVTFSAKMPGTNITLIDFSAQKLLVVYFVIFLLSLLVSRETRMQFLPDIKQTGRTI